MREAQEEIGKNKTGFKATIFFYDKIYVIYYPLFTIHYSLFIP